MGNNPRLKFGNGQKYLSKHGFHFFFFFSLWERRIVPKAQWQAHPKYSGVGRFVTFRVVNQRTGAHMQTNGLLHHLRFCLIYFGILPKTKRIKLVRIAEGFIKEENNTGTMEEVVNHYLLSSRERDWKTEEYKGRGR